MLFTGTKKECDIFLSGMAAYKYNFNKQVENDKDNL
jgi:hypothetical protein